MSNILKGIEIAKRFGKTEVLASCSVEFQSGEVVGIIGENGSGKTVLLKILCGLMKADRGAVSYNGEQLGKELRFLPSVGVIIENPGFFDDLSGIENLEILASIQGVISTEEIKDSIKKVGLEINDKKVKNYSLGMRQRLGIAQAIMENPEVIILDEFTTALDTDGIDMAHRIVLEMKRKGKIIIITSHSKYDVDNLCDRKYQIKGGVIYEI